MRSARREQGYVLLTAILLSALVVTGSAAYCRFALFTESEDAASLDHHLSHEAALSGLAYARQVLASGSLPSSLSLDVNDMFVTVAVTEVGPDRHAVRIKALRGGLGTSLDVQFASSPVAGSELPPLTADAVAALTTGGLSWVRDGTTLSDTVITGDLFIERGARVTLRNVVVQGGIVSQGGLLGPPFLEMDGVELIVQGGLRVDGRGATPGLALYLPAGNIFGRSDSRIEWNGSVLADSLHLDGSGSLSGLLTTVAPARLSPSIDRPGFGRGPTDWPGHLVPSARKLHWMAFPVPLVSAGEIAAIGGFQFPEASAAVSLSVPESP